MALSRIIHYKAMLYCEKRIVLRQKSSSILIAFRSSHNSTTARMLLVNPLVRIILSLFRVEGGIFTLVWGVFGMNCIPLIVPILIKMVCYRKG